jgi:hypothetical protein
MACRLPVFAHVPSGTRKMNFTIDQNARFSDAPEPPLTTADLVRRVRNSLAREGCEENGPQRKPLPNAPVNTVLGSQGPLAKPVPPSGAITIARQYRYRGARISLSKSESGKWKAAWPLFVDDVHNCARLGQSIIEGPTCDSEALAASHAMHAIDLALDVGGQNRDQKSAFHRPRINVR